MPVNAGVSGVGAVGGPSGGHTNRAFGLFRAFSDVSEADQPEGRLQHRQILLKGPFWRANGASHSAGGPGLRLPGGGGADRGGARRPFPRAPLVGFLWVMVTGAGASGVSAGRQ
jgi:hypothetical protein